MTTATRAVAFYRDVLGVPFIAKYDPPGLALFDMDGVRLMLSNVEEERGERHSAPLYFAVDDIDAAHRALFAKGVVFTHDPHVIHNDAEGVEEWMGFFRDPDQHVLAIASKRATSVRSATGPLALAASRRGALRCSHQTSASWGYHDIHSLTEGGAPTCDVKPANVDRDELRTQIQAKYSDVAVQPELGFHFHTGRPLAAMLGYSGADVDWLPESTVESFAGTGNPLSAGELRVGATVLDLGSGAGFDSLLAARQVGPSGRVIPVDMTNAMLEKTRADAEALGLDNVDPRLGYAEELPVEDGEVDVVISNGVINLTPDKVATLTEINRALKPGGRIQIADILVHTEVPQDAKDDIDLWSG